MAKLTKTTTFLCNRYVKNDGKQFIIQIIIEFKMNSRNGEKQQIKGHFRAMYSISGLVHFLRTGLQSFSNL